jgi:hypothetical protein
MTIYDLMIKNGILVDPANGREGRFDVALESGRVAEVAPELDPARAREIYPADGKLVLPGLVDTHVHLTPPLRAAGFAMLARAGVTCALDCAGPAQDIVEGMALRGSGISVAVLNKLDPGVTISGPDASAAEVAEYMEKSLNAGAFGLKLLGGHLPLSPETTAAAIDCCNRARAYVAFHCGSTRNGSNLKGFLDAMQFAGSNRLHICHVNAYCRGLTLGDPVQETQTALKTLAGASHIISESHMARYNSCWARLENGVPRSHVTRTCLHTGGYTADRDGLVAAARDGYMRVHKVTAGEVLLSDPDEGLAHLEAVDFETMVSFPVNRRSTAFLCATAKDENGRFAVTALSTDGGGIPRNFLLSHGLSLVRFDAISLSEFVHKCAIAPARMLGLMDKGHLGPGADGDVVVADPHSHRAELTLAGGRIVMINGTVIGTGGTLITTRRGAGHLADIGVPHIAVDLEQSLLYAQRRETA